MHQNLFLLTSLLVFTFLSSQEKTLGHPNSYEEIYKNVKHFIEAKDYQNIITEFEKLNKNDSLYCDVLLSKSFYAIQLKDFPKAESYIMEGLSLPCVDVKESFCQNLASVLINQEKYDKAISVLQEALDDYPKNSKLWYNLGVAHENSRNYEEAISCYIKTIAINPFYKRPFAQLGGLCAKKGLVSQALMCYNMFLILEPENSFQSLNYINNYSGDPDKEDVHLQVDISDKDDVFEEIDLVLKSGLSLNKDYETGNKININLVRQNHALLEQLNGVDIKGGFWGNKMVPFYLWINENNLFDEFVYTVTYSIKNEKFKSEVDKNLDKIRAFVENFKTKWNQLATQEWVEVNGQRKLITNYFEDYTQGVGELVNDTLIGEWTFFNKNGSFKSMGSFDMDGNREGKWIWFTKSKDTGEIAHYKNGKLSGTNISYYDNGNIEFKTSYTDDNLNGLYEYYNEKGALIQKKYFKAGELDGLYESYFATGKNYPEYQIPYSNGKITGEVIQYFASGDTLSTINFLNGNREGEEKTYFAHGPLSSLKTYKEGQLNGPIKSFHPNGQIHEKGNAIDGYYNGVWIQFHPNGNKKNETAYDNGYIDGPYKEYDKDGKLHYEYEYRKGEVIAFTFYNKKGEVISNGRKKGGEFYYVEKSSYGVTTSEGQYDIKGGKSGTWNYYNGNGVLTNVANYTDNLLEGEYTVYYNTGELLSKSHYSKDTIQGYYEDYYENGQINSQGWYNKGNMTDEWLYYREDGTLASVNFYHKGERHGEQKYYNEVGKLYNTDHYSFGKMLHEKYIDKDGNVVQHINYQTFKSDTTLILKHSNGQPRYKIEYKHGVRNGWTTYFDYYGNVLLKGKYLNNLEDGKWISYWPNGQIKQIANYINGNLHGEFENYYEDGTLEDNYPYVLNNANGQTLSYHENGEIFTISEYVDDQLHGRKEFYDNKGNLELIRFYSYGRLIGYSHLDQEGNELEMIPIRNETATIKAKFKNGMPSRSMKYLNGEFDGPYLEYHYNGKLATKNFYKHGKYDGKTTEYFEDGTIKSEENYLLGKQHGQYTKYHENGQIKETGHHLNGIRTGLTMYYNENGNKTKEELFSNDEIIDVKLF